MTRSGKWSLVSAALLALGIFGAARVWQTSEAGRCITRSGMVALPSGAGLIGEDGPDHPGRLVRTSTFRIDRTEVTNRAFARFVQATSFVTEAERQGGAAVFTLPKTLALGIEDPSQWWRFVRGASWRHPLGPTSDLYGRWDEPVVDVTFADAQEYAQWRHGRLPTELQWEYAARGGSHVVHNAEEWSGAGQVHPIANIWGGIFPLYNDKADGFEGLAPVGCFPANGFGLYDMIGNVWEWTSVGEHRAALRGGSFLCSANYCANYRPAGRQIQEAGLASSHAGFRIAGDRNTSEP